MNGNIFVLEDGGGETVNIRNVPVFMTHSDRDYNCDEAWLDRCIDDFENQRDASISISGDRKYVMLPSLTIGHTPVSPDAPEPPCAGFVDNLRRTGNVLYADFVDVPSDNFMQMKRGMFPYRSAEVIPSKCRLTNISLLGGRYPHFALPVMKFSDTLDGENVLVVRYTMMGDNPMAAGQQTQPQPGAPAGQPIDINQLAQTLAPIVAQLLANTQANAPAITQGAAVYRHRGRVDRHAGEDPHNDAQQVKDGVDVDTPVKKDDGTDMTAEAVGGHTEDFKGEKMTIKSLDEAVKYIGNLSAEVKRLSEENAELRKDVHTLNDPSKAAVTSSKRSLLRSKVKEVAALGYAVGDRDAIERHVERMMPMSNEEIVNYIGDVLKSFPKVDMGVERHGTHDTVRRPGMESENSRYAAENKSTLDSMGLNKDLLDLSDMLG